MSVYIFFNIQLVKINKVIYSVYLYVHSFLLGSYTSLKQQYTVSLHHFYFFNTSVCCMIFLQQVPDPYRVQSSQERRENAREVPAPVICNNTYSVHRELIILNGTMLCVGCIFGSDANDLLFPFIRISAVLVFLYPTTTTNPRWCSSGDLCA